MDKELILDTPTQKLSRYVTELLFLSNFYNIHILLIDPSLQKVRSHLVFGTLVLSPLTPY